MKIKFISSCLIAGICIAACSPGTTADTAVNNTLPAGKPSDTIKIEASPVVKGLFVNETWCNGTMQTWQKPLYPLKSETPLLKQIVTNRAIALPTRTQPKKTPTQKYIEIYHVVLEFMHDLLTI